MPLAISFNDRFCDDRAPAEGLEELCATRGGKAQSLRTRAASRRRDSRTWATQALEVGASVEVESLSGELGASRGPESSSAALEKIVSILGVAV